jgi:hypothetical protein
VDVDVVGNLVRRQEPRCHLAQIHLMTKTETRGDQGPCGSMVDPMGDHLPNLRQEVSEPIGKVRPRWQHHHNSADRCVMKRRVALAIGLR